LAGNPNYLKKEEARMANKVRLTLTVAETPHTSKIRSGAIPIEGVDTEIITVEPMIAAFRRMVRDVEFDICALAPVTYVIARAYGYPFKALPVFIQRGFHHGGLLVRPDAGIKVPKDLEGKNVGVRAYSVTSGAWTRAVLIDEYGLDPSKVTWVVDDEEHVTKLTLPPNVIRTPEGKSLNGMMAAGEIQAGGSWSGRNWPDRLSHERMEACRDELSGPVSQRRGAGSRLVQAHRDLSGARHDRSQGFRSRRASLGGQVHL
jgi:hypothetical protein